MLVWKSRSDRLILERMGFPDGCGSFVTPREPGHTPKHIGSVFQGKQAANKNYFLFFFLLARLVLLPGCITYKINPQAATAEGGWSLSSHPSQCLTSATKDGRTKHSLSVQFSWVVFLHEKNCRLIPNVWTRLFTYWRMGMQLVRPSLHRVRPDESLPDIESAL